MDTCTCRAESTGNYHYIVNWLHSNTKQKVKKKELKYKQRFFFFFNVRLRDYFIKSNGHTSWVLKTSKH